jgi:hypothetical protein
LAEILFVLVAHKSFSHSVIGSLRIIYNLSTVTFPPTIQQQRKAGKLVILIVALPIQIVAPQTGAQAS